MVNFKESLTLLSALRSFHTASGRTYDHDRVAITGVS